jgi:hypothetical protein
MKSPGYGVIDAFAAVERVTSDTGECAQCVDVFEPDPDRVHSLGHQPMDLERKWLVRKCEPSRAREDVVAYDAARGRRIVDRFVRIAELGEQKAVDAIVEFADEFGPLGIERECYQVTRYEQRALLSRRYLLEELPSVGEPLSDWLDAARDFRSLVMLGVIASGVDKRKTGMRLKQEQKADAFKRQFFNEWPDDDYLAPGSWSALRRQHTSDPERAPDAVAHPQTQDILPVLRLIVQLSRPWLAEHVEIHLAPNMAHLTLEPSLLPKDLVGILWLRELDRLADPRSWLRCAHCQRLYRAEILYPVPDEQRGGESGKRRIHVTPRRDRKYCSVACQKAARRERS